MKFFAIILVAFSLSGCFYQSVNQYDLNEAVKICGGVEKTAHIVSDFLGEESVTCMDGTRTSLHKWR